MEKMEKGKRLLKNTLIVLSAAAIAISVSSCGKKEAKTGLKKPQVTDKIYRVTDEPVKLTYWVKNDKTNAVSNYAEIETYRVLQEKTGVEIEFLHPVGVWHEQLPIMFAADDLPDIIETVNSNVVPGGGPDKAIEDGKILRLNELIEEYAPNYQKARLSDEEARRLTVTDGGNMFCFPKLFTFEAKSWGGPLIRKDLLEDLNLKKPETFDDWYHMLKAFKEYGIEIPLMADNPGWDTTREFGVFIGGFDVNKGFIVGRDGKIKFGQMEEGYKRYLQTFNKWYQEGLIDPEFDTRSGDSRAEYLTSGKVGASVAVGFGDFEVVAAPYPVENRGDKARFRQKNWRNGRYEAYITSKCKYPEIAVMWFDTHYTKEGADLFEIGQEGVTYELVNGEYVWTDTIMNYPGGKNVGLNKYTIVNSPHLVRTPDSFEVLDPIEVRKVQTEDAQAIWSDGPTDGMLPPLTFRTEESDELNSFIGEINSYAAKMYVEFIKGTTPLDYWDEYVSTLKEMGIDRAIEIYQGAYDRLMSR